MIQYLQKIFGSDISMAPYIPREGLPFYLYDGYKFELYTLYNSSCIILTPTDLDIRLPQLKKHYEIFRKYCDLPCALNLNKLTAAQRNNLIENHIPFVSVKQQIYLPFWGSIFTDSVKANVEAPEIMTPTTQLIFFYLIYQSKSGKENINSAEILSALDIPKSSISRAIQELNEYSLIELRADGTIKWISITENALQKALTHMRSPISKTIYLKSIPEGIPYKIGNIKALAELTILASNERDGSIVFEKHDAQRIPRDLIITKRNFDDFGGVIAESWIYDPAKLSNTNTVDELSLLLSLKDSEDERIQNELDSIRKKYDIEVE